jgi:hypothetical protein
VNADQGRGRGCQAPAPSFALGTRSATPSKRPCPPPSGEESSAKGHSAPRSLQDHRQPDRPQAPRANTPPNGTGVIRTRRISGGGRRRTNRHCRGHALQPGESTVDVQLRRQGHGPAYSPMTRLPLVTEQLAVPQPVLCEVGADAGARARSRGTGIEVPPSTVLLSEALRKAPRPASALMLRTTSGTDPSSVAGGFFAIWMQKSCRERVSRLPRTRGADLLSRRGATQCRAGDAPALRAASASRDTKPR